MTDHSDIRRVVLERDEYRCVRCGSLLGEGWRNLHHRVLGDRAKNEPWNLIFLCTTCHTWCHAHSAAAREGGWIVSRHAKEPQLVPVRYCQPGRTGWYALNQDFTVTEIRPVEVGEEGGDA